MSAATASSVQVRMPSSAWLRQLDGPAFTLREHRDDGLPDEGSAYDEREFGDNTVAVGCVYFCADMRNLPAGSPLPSSAELQSYMAARRMTPFVVRRDGPDNQLREIPHIVMATLDVSLHVDNPGVPVLNAHGGPTIRLFTIAADCASAAFAPATHFLGGKQYEGVTIRDWDLVDFDEEFQAATLAGSFGKIFKYLTEGAENWD